MHSETKRNDWFPSWIKIEILHLTLLYCIMKFCLYHLNRKLFIPASAPIVRTDIIPPSDTTKRWSHRSKASSSSTDLQALYGPEDNGKRGKGGGRMKRLSMRLDNAYYDNLSSHRPSPFSHSSRIPRTPALIAVSTFDYFDKYLCGWMDF